MKKIYDKIFIEKDIIYLIISISLICIVIITTLFLWNRDFFNLDSTIDETLLGTLGDFIGGIIGSAWALIGVILFYLALKEQRNDIKTNRKALGKQIEALEMQTNEFSLQKEELSLTRNVFKEQTNTLKKQQFESTFFNMLNLYNHIVSNISNNNGQDQEDLFEKFSRELINLSSVIQDPIKNHFIVLNAYKKLFYKKKTEISHYFRIVYRIMRFIELSSINEEDKQSYSKIVRSQFSEKELLILYYNSHFIFGKKFVPIALKYNLFKHLPDDSKVEFNNFHSENVNYGFNRLVFLNEIKLRIKDFLFETKEETSEISYPVSRSYYNEDVKLIVNIEILNFDINEMNISFMKIDNIIFEKFFGFSVEIGLEYFNHHFHHLFIFSKYIDHELQTFKIHPTQENNSLNYLIKNNNQFSL